MEKSIKKAQNNTRTIQTSLKTSEFQLKPEKTREFLEKLPTTFESPDQDEILNSSRLSKSSESDDHLKSSMALYTFTKESSLTTSNAKVSFDSNIMKTPKINPGIYESPYFKSKKQVKEKPEIPLLKTPNLNENLQSISTQLEVEKLKKIILKQQKIIQAKDQQISKMTEMFEKKMRNLESVNEKLRKSSKKFPCHGHSNSYSPLIPTHAKSDSASSAASQKNEIFYPNGSRCEVYPNGYKVTYFANHDIKQEHPDGIIIYFFAKQQTTKTTFKDGMQIVKFRNGQTEKIFTDGTKEIRLPDGTVRCVFNNGEEIVCKTGKF
jgi:hypothetical protein